MLGRPPLHQTQDAWLLLPKPPEPVHPGKRHPPSRCATVGPEGREKVGAASRAAAPLVGSKAARTRTPLLAPVRH